MNGNALKGIGIEMQGAAARWNNTDGSRREKAESGKAGRGTKKQRLGSAEQCRAQHTQMETKEGDREDEGNESKINIHGGSIRNSKQ